MKTYIALFRGVNVGGNNLLSMKDLVILLEKLDSHGVKTYIQSGNAVFRNAAESGSWLLSRISAEIKKTHGFEPQVFLLELEDLEKAIELNPFPEAESTPQTLHLFFLGFAPENPDLQALENMKRDSERCKLIDNVFYLHAPEGIGRSKLASRVEKSLGVAATARNWRSVGKILNMAKHRD
ncbi:MAG: DUF1697 domain-containing protein [Candidatus Ozemobacteraceae bacterium]